MCKVLTLASYYSGTCIIQLFLYVQGSICRGSAGLTPARSHEMVDPSWTLKAVCKGIDYNWSIRTVIFCKNNYFFAEKNWPFPPTKICQILQPCVSYLQLQYCIVQAVLLFCVVELPVEEGTLSCSCYRNVFRIVDWHFDKSNSMLIIPCGFVYQRG